MDQEHELEIKMMEHGKSEDIKIFFMFITLCFSVLDVHTIDVYSNLKKFRVSEKRVMKMMKVHHLEIEDMEQEHELEIKVIEHGKEPICCLI